MRRSLLLICSYSLSSLLFAQFNTPSSREVVRQFYARYTFNDDTYPYVQFEKREGYWSVVLQRVEGGRVIPYESYPFFILHQNLFAPLPLDTLAEPQPVDPEEKVPPFELDLYDLNPSYGYPGWYKDVVQILEKQQALSDTQLYALGRAWSAWSGSLLTNASGYAVESEIWKTPFSTNGLTAEQIRQFLEISNKGIAAFRQLAERTPAFSTVVGPIHRKYANEVMWQYQNLMTRASRYADSMRLPDNLYTEDEQADARKWLKDCPPGAVLLSMGDNDFYPVHYLQKKLGFRTDVHLVNYSLLGMPASILRAQEPQYRARPVKFSIPAALYRDPLNEVLYLKPGPRILSIAGLRAALQSAARDEDGRLTLTAGSFVLNRSTPRKLSLGSHSYLVLNHWILLDLLQQLGTRPFCTTQPFYDEMDILNPLLKQHGSLRILRP